MPVNSHNYEGTYLISWMGLPGLDTQRNNIANSSLSLVRKLEIKDNYLYQSPLDFEKYLINTSEIKDKNCELDEIKPMRLKISDIKDDLTIQIYGSDKENSGLILSYKNDKLNLDRRYLEDPINTSDTNLRSINTRPKNLEIFIDKSSVEVFVNDGKYVLSSRIFPKLDENKLIIKAKSEINIKLSEIIKMDKKFII